jgi:hypothetical protein
MAFLVAAGAWALAAATAQAAAKPAPNSNCFLTTQWRGWTASQDGDVLYLRVGLKDVYRLGLVPNSRVRKDADRFLVNRVRGSSWVCSPIDLDMDLADHFGFRQHVFVREMRKLTPEEVAALPKKEVPY